MINVPMPVAQIVEAKPEEQSQAVNVTDPVSAPPDNQPNPTVLSISSRYINKYRSLWEALAK